MSDKWLAANLVEISYAGHSSDLVVLGSRIYHGSYGLGRIIKWLLYVFPCLGSKEADLKVVSEKIRNLFFHKIEQLGKASGHLRKGFKRLLEGKEITNPGFFKAKDVLLSFSAYLDPFMKDLRKEKPSKALSFLTADIPNQESVEEIAVTIKDLFADLHFYQKAFSFEEITKMEIPLHFLQKMSLDIRLNVREEKKVKKWLDQLTKSAKWNIPSFEGKLENSYIQTRSIHRMLCKIVEFINQELPDLDDEFNSEVEALEANLVNLGYQIFDQNDYRHIAWRRSLEEGEEIAWNGKQLILGEVLENEDRKTDEPVVFSVIDEPGMEIVIYHNESWSYLKRFQESILHCGIEGRKILGLSEFGRIVIQERLYDSLEDITWDSTTDLTKKDKATSLPIVQLLQGLRERPFTPIVGEDSGNTVIGALHPEHFAFNSDDQLRAAECLVPGHFCFDTLENFAFECSKGNFLVFSHIMQASGLGKTSAANKYQKLFEDSLKDKDAYIAISCNTSIIDAALLKKRTVFYNYTRNHFEECIKFNQAVYEIKKLENFRQLFIKELIKIKKTLCPGSISDPYLFSHAIYSTFAYTQPVMKKEAFEKKIQEIIKSKDKSFLTKEHLPYFDRGIYSPKQIQAARKRITKAMK